MDKKIVLITGANKGIGFETARQLGKQDFTVLLGARTHAKAEQAAAKLSSEGFDVRGEFIDPTNASTIQALMKKIDSEFGRLDVLINNAGTIYPEDYESPIQVSTEVLRKTYELNVFGLHEVTKTFWTLLNKSKAARLVNVSSLLGSLTTHAEGGFGDFMVLAYDSSKAAVNMMTIHYAALWKGTPHKANTIHPGSVKTDLNPTGELTVEVGAKTSVELATVGSDGPNGRFFHLGKELPW